MWNRAGSFTWISIFDLRKFIHTCYFILVLNSIHLVNTSTGGGLPGKMKLYVVFFESPPLVFGIVNSLMWPSNQLIYSLDLLKSYHWIRWCDLWICLFELWVCSCDPWIRSNWYNQFSIDLLNIWFHSFATGGKFASTHPIQKLKAGIQQEGGDAKKINLLI